MKTSALVLLATLLVAPAARAQDWATYQGDPSHTGYVPIATSPRGILPLWTRTFPAPLNPPAIGGGRVFVTETGRFQTNVGLHALDGQSGVTVWSLPDFGDVSSVNPPAVGNGTVYVQTGKGLNVLDPYLYALDAATGTPRFRVPFAAQWDQYLAPTPYQGDVYVNGGYYGGAYRFDGTDGTERWFAGLPQYDGWTPAVDAAYVYAYFGAALYVRDRQTGAAVFSIPDPNASSNGFMSTAPVLTHDGDVLATYGGRLIRFDVQGRAIQWELSRDFRGQVAAKGDVIYANDGGTLTAWNALTGGLLWTWLGPGSGVMTGNIVVTDTHAFVQSSTTTYAVNLATRATEWSYAAAGSIAIGDGLLAITSGSTIHVFSVAVNPSQPLPPTGLTAARITGNQVTLRFTPPIAGAAPTGYVLEGGVSPGGTLVSLPIGDAPEVSLVAPDGVFFVRVRSLAGAQVSAASNEIRLAVKQPLAPSAPTSLTGLATGSSLQLSWKNTFDGGPVDHVVLEVGGRLVTAVLLGPDETFHFDGVPDGTYVFTVRAQNATGASAATSGVTLTFPGSCSAAPHVPAAFVAYRTGNVVRLSWDPPADGPAPLGYRVNVTGALLGSFAVSGRELAGPVPPGTYNLSVAAVNPCGNGPATAVQTVTVP
jgi:outer membrane protein assembly factor BamB